MDDLCSFDFCQHASYHAWWKLRSGGQLSTEQEPRIGQRLELTIGDDRETSQFAQAILESKPRFDVIWRNTRICGVHNLIEFGEKTADAR